MKEELTRIFEKSELKTMIAFYQNNDCSRRTARELATALLEEMDKPKVWDGAPEDAKIAEVCFFNNLYCDSGRADMVYTRELPKTRARIMAEEIAAAQISNKSDLVDIIEQTINTHMKELKGKDNGR